MMQAQDRALPSQASVVIVGGGIQGLACAFNLARNGRKGVLVLDAGYWQGGASGRNGTLIRGGFGSQAWIELFEFSTRCWQDLSRTLGHNTMFSRRGYTMVAETERTAGVLNDTIRLHHHYGVKAELLSGAGVRRVLPAIRHDKVLNAIHLADGGVAPHHAGMKAFHAACLEAGVDVRYRTRVTGIETQNGRAAAVLVGDHRIAAETIVVAAGGFNLTVAEMAGVTVPGHSMRIEAMALEPIRPLIGPGIALIDSLCYMHQTARGEVVGGTEVPERPRMSLTADFPVLARTAGVYARLFPQLAELRILRHWAGLIHATPDWAPMIGPHPELRDLWFSAGWSYGWTGGPGTGVLLARSITEGRVERRLQPFALDRFARGAPLIDKTIVM